MSIWRRRRASGALWINAPRDIFEPDVPVTIEGLTPLHKGADVRVFRSRLERAALEYVRATHAPGLSVAIRVGADVGQTEAQQEEPPRAAVVEREADTDRDRRGQFIPVQPRPGLDLLVVPPSTKEQLLSAVSVLSVGEQVFETWNLKSIEPCPLSAINLYGPPGTGKTLAAHGIAHYLGKPLLAVKTSQLESMFHGEGAKNVEAIFAVAAESEAVLFVDEADSLLSRRIASPMQGSEHAVNTMRSELFLSLDTYSGIVVFATNLVDAYDAAFESRVLHVGFALPDREARAEIWRRHLPEELPLAEDVSIPDLAALDGLSGRDIKRAVVSAAVDIARRGLTELHQDDLINAARLSSSSPGTTDHHEASDGLPAGAEQAVRQALARGAVPAHDLVEAIDDGQPVTADGQT